MCWYLKYLTQIIEIEDIMTTESVEVLNVALIIPESVNLSLLILGIYGMYQGIQIIHPLYAILFLNLIIQALSSLLSCISFPFLATEKFVRLSNGNNSLALLLHCTAWCLTSMLR